MNRLPLPSPLVALATLAVLAVLAGCATAPTEPTTTPPGTETFEVRMTGNSSATYVVSADLVADPFRNVTVAYANGTNGTVAVPELRSAVTYGPESDVTSVEPSGEVVGGVYFEGSPNFSVSANDVPPTGNAVFAVREKGEAVLVAWGLVQCDGHVSDISLAVSESGIDSVGFACEP